RSIVDKYMQRCSLLRFRTRVAVTALFLSFFFFYAPATTVIYTLSLHDALPILVLLPVVPLAEPALLVEPVLPTWVELPVVPLAEDRKSTRLNSSHVAISYAVFCLKKKKSLDGPAIARVRSRA